MSLGNSQVLLVGVNDPDSGGDLAHVADTAERTLQLLLLATHHEQFLLGAAGTGNIVEVNKLKLAQTRDTLGNGLEVGEHAAKPTLVDVRHANALSLLLDSGLGLLLGADEENVSTVSDGLLDEVERLVDVINGLLQIDDVNRVAIREDVTLHLRVPTAGLVPEVHAGFKQLAHGNDCHGRPFWAHEFRTQFGFCATRDCGAPWYLSRLLSRFV